MPIREVETNLSDNSVTAVSLDKVGHPARRCRLDRVGACKCPASATSPFLSIPPSPPSGQQSTVHVYTRKQRSTPDCTRLICTP